MKYLGLVFSYAEEVCYNSQHTSCLCERGVQMNGKFFDLKKEKQDRMINAALQCFAQEGYKHASTDDIVKIASISKGLLFHYFQSKLGTFRFVFDYSVRFMNLELRTYVDSKETDLFEILKQVEFARMHVLKGYPRMQQFLSRASRETDEEAFAVIEDKKIALEETYRTIYSQIDYSTLPAGVDGEKLRKMMEFTIKGLMEEEFLKEEFQPEELYQEICAYLDMEKKLLA